MSSYAGVSLFHANDGSEWAKYIRSKLGSTEYAIHSVLNNITADPGCHTKSTNVNIFLISPDFQDLKNWDIIKEFNPSTTLAILTGIDSRDLKKEAHKHRCKEVLDWLIHELTESSDSVREMMLTIVAAYEGALREEKQWAVSPAILRRTTPTEKQDRFFDVPKSSNYDFLPPLRQVNGLHGYVIEDDKLFVILHRSAEEKLYVQHADDHKTSPDGTNPASVYVFKFPKEVQGQQFHIKLGARDIGSGEGKTDSADKHHSHTVTDKTNQSIDTERETAKVPQSSKTSMDVGVQTELCETDIERPNPANIHRRYVSKLDQIYDLLKDELDPEELLCQCLGIEKERVLLDEKMKSMIESTEALRHLSYPVNCQLSEESESSSNWPTLLHFGAQFNLLNFCDALLINPLMHGACLTRNKDHLYPHDLARQHGHSELSILLKHYSNYVTSSVEREGKYDSGISCGTPRLSTITLPRDSQSDLPPKPHCSRSLSKGYTSMQDVPEENVTESEREKTPPTPPPRVRSNTGLPVRTISEDVGFNEGEDYQEYDRESSRVSSASSNSSADDTSGPFGRILTYSPDSLPTSPDRLAALRVSGKPNRLSKDSTASYESNKSSYYTDDDSEEVSPNRKNIVSHLGMEVQHSPTAEKKSFFKEIFKTKKKVRSTSESTGIAKLKSSAKIYKRESNRSSSTSTSSNSSTNLQEPKAFEDTFVPHREEEDKKSKKKFKLFMSKAQRRKSIRIKNVMEDKNMSGPILPPRRRQISETF